MKYDPFDSILSAKSKKNKKDAEAKPYFENTHDTLGLYNNQTSNEDEESEKGRPKGMALLKKIYGAGTDASIPCWKGYEQFGMKMKNGKQVPNCIPKASNRQKKGGGQVASFLTSPNFTERAETATSQPEIDRIYRDIRSWSRNQSLQIQDPAVQLIRRGMVAAIQQNNLNANRQGADRLQSRNIRWEVRDRIPPQPRPFQPPNPPRPRGGCGIIPCKTSCKKKVKDTYNRVVDNYSDVVNHLEEHLQEKAGDPLDAKQSKYLKGEIKRINELHLTPALNVRGNDPLYQVSNPREVQRKALQLYGRDAIVYKSDKPNKKYQILNKNTGKWVYFGDEKMEDFHYHKDPERRRRYLARALNIRGKWRENIYSPNILSLVLLWNAD
jgi:hypothetical protein